MSVIRISATKGRTIGFLLTVTRPDNAGATQPIDLTIPGTKLTVTGKLRNADAAAVFTKDYWQAGGAPHGGITVPAQGYPNSVADVEVPANEPGILALTRTTYILVDAELVEANGRVTEIAGGVIKLRVTPGSP